MSILYIPGLGDRYDGFRRFALGFWKLFGVDARLVPMNWYGESSLEEKLARVKHAAEKVGKPVVIIGESAGAAVALLAASELVNTKKVITICGVARPNTPISPYLAGKAPALPAAVKKLAGLKTPPTHSIRSIYDPVVAKQYSAAKNATTHTVWITGHLLTILCCLTILSWYVVRLVRS